MFKELLFTKMVPICRQSFLQENLELTTEWENIYEACSDFIPSYSNHGICLTRNGATLDTLYKNNEYLQTFNKTFIPSRYQQEIHNIPRDISRRHYTFIIDGNRYKDLKSGKDWNITSNAKFKIGIHTPNEAADIRGWYNEIINAAAGYITTIRISLSQQNSEDPTPQLNKDQRGCRFQGENEDLSSFKSYSKVNCLLDCNMEFAEKVCGCRPWDYPIANSINNTKHSTEGRICDFFGNSCFNKILRENFAPGCDSKCMPDCNKITYSMDISLLPLDPKKRICSYLAEPLTNLEFRIKSYILSLFSNSVRSAENVANIPPERRMMNTLKDILMKSNVTHYANETRYLAFERDCTGKLDSDIAVVVVSVVSPVFSRATKRVRATLFDKIANIGKIMFLYI